MLLFSSGDMLKQLATAPPRDLASLLNPETALVAMQVKTDQDALIALLTAPKEGAAGEADAAGVEYVKKLLAMRRLEQMKSEQALAALDAVAGEKDITLADAARQAAAIIRGQPLNRPSGREILKELSGRLPDDLGFVAVLDCERDSGEKPAAQYLQEARQSLEKQFPAEVIAAMPLNENAVTRMTQGLIRAIGETGNIRLDAVVMMVTRDYNPPVGTGQIAFIFKGLGDPERLRRTMFGRLNAEREFKGHRICYRDFGEDGVQRADYGEAVCFLDERTLVWASPERADRDEGKPQYMERILEALARDTRAEQPPATREAFDLVTQKGRRFAASGALAEGQKAAMQGNLATDLEARRERMAQWNEDDRRLPNVRAQVSMGQAMLDLTLADRFSCYLDADGVFQMEGVCADEKTAGEVADSFVVLDDDVRAAVRSAVERMGLPLFGAIDFAKDLWHVEAAGKSARMSLDPASVARRLLPALSFGRQRVGTPQPQRAPAPPGGPAPVAPQPAEQP